MGRTRSRRPGQRLSPTLAGATDAARCSRTFRPRLELLEQRVQLGDTILGLSAVALWGLDFPSVDAPLVLDPGGHDAQWDHGLFTRLDAAASLSLADSRNHVAGGESSGDHAAITSAAKTAGGFALPMLLDDDALAAHMAVYRLAGAALALFQALPADVGVTGGVGALWLGSGAPLSPLALAAIGAPAGRSLEMVAVSGAGSSGPGSVSFDVSTGRLAIRADGGDHTVREAVTADGFVDVTLDGQRHSSNPASASFDRALAGATAATVAGIRYDGGGQDRLVLGSQHLAGGFTVQATGATVVTEALLTAGPLAVRAPNITVSGALRGSTVSLAASGWVTVDAAGRIDAVPASSRGRIEVAAGVFVNSGQLHADGPSGGQINVQAGNIMNAGPITADATGPGANGGQVHIAFTGAYIATTAAGVSASSAASPGGHVTIDGGSSGRVYSSGRQQATGTVGGAVDLFGRELVLAGATVDASGAAGGGSVHIGRDFQGRNPAAANAQTVTVTPATTIGANALSSGGGGRVFVGADQTTEFAGAVSARGGPAGGPGGFIEVSGRGDVNYGGTADAGARLGKSGTLLLDPKNIVISASPAGLFPQFDLVDPHPTAGGGFGSGVSVLSNGNVVVTNPNDDFGGSNAGAVYLFDGLSGALISSLVGSNPGDLVGAINQDGYGSPAVTSLSNGNYVVLSPLWNGQGGAVTWGNGSTGVSGTVTAANSLVGSNPGELVGRYGVTPLSNGNYVVRSPSWNGQRGAVTWGDGSTGVSGTVSAANSLVGSNPGDGVGNGFPGVRALSNGNYVVDSPNWNGNRGAVTWGNATTGVSGTVSAVNSLVSSKPNDYVGLAVTPLSNGNYVVASEYWNGGVDNGRGAVTWGNGSTGVSGTVSAANSLVGSNPGELVGRYGVTLLSNGNYVVASPPWNGQRGAVTWVNGSTGISGTVSAANSLVGSNPGEGVVGSVIALSNGNYVVVNPGWNGQRGAVTWEDGSTGVSGTVSVSAANSLVGSNPGDLVGFGPYRSSITTLSNGNYVVDSPYWNGNTGAVTWGNGSTGVSGTVSDANSLVGSNPGDRVGGGYDDMGNLVGIVTPLSNGNYVVDSPNWNGNRGAVTWGNASTGVSGAVSDANSLVGSKPGDGVGYGGRLFPFIVVALSNGNYVVRSPFWKGRGAVTWGNGSTGVSGIVSAANSLVGSNPGDLVGAINQDGYGSPAVTSLSNGNYVVLSPLWNGQRGAVTWGNGSTGVSGTVTAANSLVGSNPGDGVGYGGVTPLSNGNYVVPSPLWNSRRGAATWVSGTSGLTLDGLGTITPQNSLIGRDANAGFRADIIEENPIDQTFLAPFVTDGGGRVTAGFTDPSRLTYATAQTQSVTITPAFLTRTLNTGTAVVLQASNDITVNSPVTVSAGGNGGALTLQAGRSILLNAPIITDNGALTLIADDKLANGVVDSQRDAGNAVITMAPGTALDTGSGALTVELRDGAGLTNRDSGAITLQTVTAGSVSVVNNGPSPGSDVNLGPVTSSGPQSYVNPNGTTMVTGNLTATDNPITFNHSVVLNAGLTLSAGSSTVNFAAGTVSPSPGVVTVAGGVVLTGSTTLTATLNGTDPGSYSQLAASGPINLGGSTLSLVLGFEPPVGTTFEIVTNTGSGPITGTFNGLDEGAVFTQSGYQFQITYQGGTGGNSGVVTRLV